MTGTLVQIGEVKGDFNNAESPESKVDSIINDIISKISQADVKIDIRDRSFPSKVKQKIDHNQLKENRKIVIQYKNYSSHIESSYNIIEKSIVNGKQTAMLILNEMYSSALRKFNIDAWEPDMDNIKKHADEIIDDVKKQLSNFLYKSSNVTFTKEQMSVGINVVIAHAFVECYVLENPNDTN
ncbi:hypothetical protein DLR60_14835 [Vibrio tarriae]|uniref:hypothetical protein n=1 Tax=Vibrionaceae TaxID=641 RepID=UPI00098633B2|nr:MULTISPECIES: hypothetical protein [Vibrionaceae]ELY5254250.1 hypothetical protein [Vibrio cholerae]OOF20540.1 hypothetical protein BZJ18_16880 [Salinivibrio sp. IB872]RBM67331.1 hypothetical protein DLR60_14835 [Vibrio tarriae]HDI3135376.1 hypothetical protein [Vibrio cholerae]